MADTRIILQEQLALFHPLDEEALEALCRPWEEVSYGRKQLLTRIGETERYLYLVLEGVQRAYYTHNDKDATLVFSYAPSFSGVVDSFLLQQPSAYQLETITRSRLLRMHYHDLADLMEQHRSIETWVRVAVTRVLAGTLQRQVELMAFSAEEKFTTLLQRSPQILNLIPHKYLASYIDVDPATFSKMLARVKLF
ncbi:MAG: cyclic nucleotide-binding domain-containing protein [Flavipsychrobacter sp.]|nr:cyclic nucleotide-binding domain-containing protein [Flavipsychrobacter sp.]